MTAVIESDYVIMYGAASVVFCGTPKLDIHLAKCATLLLNRKQ